MYVGNPRGLRALTKQRDARRKIRQIHSTWCRAAANRVKRAFAFSTSLALAHAASRRCAAAALHCTAQHAALAGVFFSFPSFFLLLLLLLPSAPPVVAATASPFNCPLECTTCMYMYRYIHVQVQVQVHVQGTSRCGVPSVPLAQVPRGSPPRGGAAPGAAGGYGGTEYMPACLLRTPALPRAPRWLATARAVQQGRAPPGNQPAAADRGPFPPSQTPAEERGAAAAHGCLLE